MARGLLQDVTRPIFEPVLGHIDSTGSGDAPAPPEGDRIAMEDGGVILLESGDGAIALEDGDG